MKTITPTKEQKQRMIEALIELACFHQCYIEGYAHARPDALAMFYAHIHAWKVIGIEAPDGDAIRSFVIDCFDEFGEVSPYKEKEIKSRVIRRYEEWDKELN